MAFPVPSPQVRCPNCREPMQIRDLDEHDEGTIRVELCFSCAGIWFDHLASIQLAPVATIELFREIQTRRDAKSRAVSSRLECPRCTGPLTLSFDLCKAGRFS